MTPGMTFNNYPTGIWAAETQALQRELIAGGYLPALNDDGDPSADGWLGPATRAALRQREEDLAAMPAPAKPWWETRRGKGAAKLASGILVGAAGLFWSGAQDIDAAQAVEIIYAAGPQIDAAIALARQLIETLGLLLAALGLGQTFVGAWAAKGPVDATLVARVGDRELRIPARSLRNTLSPDARREDSAGFWNNDRGPLDPD